jgi:type I restriction enzyme R subunit
VSWSRRSWPSCCSRTRSGWTTTEEVRGDRRGLQRTTRTASPIEDTFAKLVELAKSLDEEQRRAVEEGLEEEALALFDLLKKENLSKAEREKLKLASRGLLDELQRLIAPLDKWTQKEQTQAEVEVFILDHVFQALPTPPFTADEKTAAAKRAYRHIWQQSASGLFPSRKAA